MAASATALLASVRALAVRLPDMKFVLDQLALLNRGHNPDAEHRSLPAGLRGALNLGHIGMLGFSTGRSHREPARP